jgi:hypothetical protein
MNRINFEPYQPPQSLLHGLVVTEGEPVLIHGIDLDGPTPGLRMVLRWSGVYWVDVDWGNTFDGPFDSLLQAVSDAKVIELIPGLEHRTWICPDQP